MGTSRVRIGLGAGVVGVGGATSGRVAKVGAVVFGVVGVSHDVVDKVVSLLVEASGRVA